MAPTAPSTTVSLYAITQQERLRSYEQGLAEGVFRPFIYPWDSLPALWLILALLILPRLPERVDKLLRLPIFLLILGHCIYVARSCRTIGLAGGYGIGLAACWGCILSVALLLVNDMKVDFRRLEVQQIPGKEGREEQLNGSAATSSLDHEASEADVRKRKNISNPRSSIPDQTGARSMHALVWQTYPKTVAHSLDWCLDLVTAFRGVNWNFRNPTVAPLSSNITSSSPTSPPSTIRQIQIPALKSFLAHYILTDIVKTLVVQDPYFLGLAPLSSPSPYPFLHAYPFLTRLLRLVLAVSATNIVLSLIFSLSPLLFPLFPTSITRTPLHHELIYPPYWHPLFPTISRSGLAGFWGKYWHQMFRYGISQPAVYLTKAFGCEMKSNAGRIIQVFTAFFLSGCIHASASYTSFPAAKDVVKRPLSGPLLFFVVQAFGIILQDAVSKMLPLPEKNTRRGGVDMLAKTGNTLFVLGWLYVTGPLLADDFARCGVWLFEPVPISFARGLMGQGWWKWGGRWAGFAVEGRWWERGLALY